VLFRTPLGSVTLAQCVHNRRFYAGCILEKAVFMDACRNGGEQIESALRTLDRAYFGLLHRDCLRALRDADAARDLVQETFIKVWQRCATFRGESELLPWIRSICRRAILDRLRQPQREVPWELEAGMTSETLTRVAELSAEQVPAAEDSVRQAAGVGASGYESFGRLGVDADLPAPLPAAVRDILARHGIAAPGDNVLQLEIEPAAP
jgi:RNA polymerase sigma factor (sigma-70 family)